MRLIDADSLMEKFDPNDVKLLDTIAVRYRIATEETVKEFNRETAEWIPYHPLQVNDKGGWKCSNCGCGDWSRGNYCFECGRKMINGISILNESAKEDYEYLRCNERESDAE